MCTSTSAQATRSSGLFEYLYVVERCNGGATSGTTLTGLSACSASVAGPGPLIVKSDILFAAVSIVSFVIVRVVGSVVMSLFVKIENRDSPKFAINASGQVRSGGGEVTPHRCRSKGGKRIDHVVG